MYWDQKVLILAVIEGGNIDEQMFNIIQNLQTPGLEYELFLVYNGLDAFEYSKAAREYEKGIANFTALHWGLKKPISRCLNETILSNNFSSKDHLCFLPSKCQLSRGWLRELVYWNDRIDNSGVVSICSDKTSGEWVPLVSKTDSMEYVHVPDQWNIYQPVLISSEAINQIGAFNETLYSGYEFADYVRRAQFYHLNSFDIPGAYSIEINFDSKQNQFVTTEEEYNDVIATHQYNYLPFYMSDPEWLEKQKTIMGLVQEINQIEPNMEAKRFIDHRTGHFGFTKPYLSSTIITMILEYVNNNDLKYFISGGDTIGENEIKVVFLKNQ